LFRSDSWEAFRIAESGVGKMTKQAITLREMTSENLELAIADAAGELFRLRFQSTTEKLDSPSNVRKFRRQIARIKTIIGERQRAEAEG
jgi:large subunit ribosomal protein L29